MNGESIVAQEMRCTAAGRIGRMLAKVIYEALEACVSTALEARGALS